MLKRGAAGLDLSRKKAWELMLARLVNLGFGATAIQLFESTK